MKQCMNRAEIYEILPLWFLMLSSLWSSLFEAELSRCDFVTFQHFLPSSFQPGGKQGGSFKCNGKAVITRLSFSFSLLSPLWPAVTFKSVFSYSSQSILSIEKAPAKPDLWTNKGCGGGNVMGVPLEANDLPTSVEFKKGNSSFFFCFSLFFLCARNNCHNCIFLRVDYFKI